MNMEKSIIDYILAIEAFRKWLVNGDITEIEFRELKSFVAESCGLPENSIYR